MSETSARSVEESELWRLCKNGDDDARESLIVSYRPLVFWLAKKFCISESLKQDLVQEGMLALIHSVDRFDEARGLHFSTFAWHRIRGQMLNLLERSERRAPLPVDDEFFEHVNEPEADDDGDVWMSIEECIENLPKREAEIVSALFNDGKEPKQIAKEQGMDVSNVYRLRRSAIAHLKAQLALDF